MPIIDCDLIAHENLVPGNQSYIQVSWYFKKHDIVNPDKSINRRKLRDVVFGSKEEKDPKVKAQTRKNLMMNNLFTQPFILQKTLAQIYNVFANGKYVNSDPNSLGDISHAVQDIPLLFETGFFLWFVFPTVCIHIKDKEIWLKRIMKRDQVDQSGAQKIIDNQLDINKKVKWSEIPQDNSKSVLELQSAFMAAFTNPGFAEGDDSCKALDEAMKKMN